MRKTLNILLILLFFALSGKSQTVLFSEDFGTTFHDIYSGSNWECKHSSASSYNTSSAPCGGTGEYAYGLSGFNYYITTKQITLGASGNQLSFDYSFDYSISNPQILISSAASCGSTGTDISGGGLAQSATCTSISYNLDAYANQTIRIVFIAKTSTKTFYFDNIEVSSGSGGGSTSCTDIFNENFGTASSSTQLLTNWCSASSYSNSSSSACEGYSWYAFGSAKYVKTNSIIIPATGTTTLYFDYKFNQFSSYPVVSISTSGCYGTYTSKLTLSYNSTCYNQTIDLSSYAGQTVNIQFYTNNSSGTFILDNVRVENCTTGGGATGSGLKWADTFNDGDSDIDFTGIDGDEDFSGASWSLPDGATIASSGSFAVNHNQTEAFNTTTDDISGYGVLLDKNESLESPTVDLSSQESFKVSFYAMKQGGTANWNSWTKLYLEYWDGSSWKTLQEIKNSSTATSTENDYFIESGFGYHCFTVHKSNTSPGNYYYRLSPHVNPDCFHSDFKLRWRLYESSSFDDPQLYLDNITFRADDDGQLVIPCGLSFWNAPEATGYGLDPEASLINNAPRGVEVETDDLFSGMKGTPDWAGHFNDGNTGGNDLYEIMWAVVSEQKISTTYAKVNFMYPDGSSPQNKTMSIDDAYSGPGYLYYYKEFADCDGSSAGSFNTGPGIIYHFYFQYGSDFRPVYTHLNASGIEIGGGATDLTEGMNPEICTSVLPVEIIDLTAEFTNNSTILSWQTASETNNDYFIVQYSENGKDFVDIGIVDGAGNSNTIQSYQFETEQMLSLAYYRLKQVDFDGTQNLSKIIAVQNQENSIDLFINYSDKNTIYITSQQEYRNMKLMIIDVSGKTVFSQKHHLFAGENKIILNNIEKGLYIVSLIDENSEFRKQKRIIIL
ncbi:MAG: T9SS type A sorting domain-containing protein [Bacteroidales bacterium]|nr:T9SS type A sorting domain-containing protein [Bacteroidales bacterium]